MGPLSDDEVIRAISRQCVPVAINREWIAADKTAVGELYRSIQKQRPTQYQGIYVIDPDGKVLSNQAKEPANIKDWARDLRQVIDSGVKAYGKVSRRAPGKFNALANRGAGFRDDGSAVLAVYARFMSLGLDRRGFGDPTYDSITLSASQLASLAVGGKAGTTWTVPTAVVQKFHKVLSGNSDPNTLARADEVTRARLDGRIERVRNGVAYLSFTGRISGSHVWEFPPNKGKKIHADVSLVGTGSCDAKTGKLFSITLVGDGEYRDIPPYDHKSRYGAVVEWQANR